MAHGTVRQTLKAWLSLGICDCPGACVNGAEWLILPSFKFFWFSGDKLTAFLEKILNNLPGKSLQGTQGVL